MSNELVTNVIPLATPWQTANPFLFCMHHDDRYPEGNDQMGPDAPLTGRNLGNDFSGKDGWSMYHGTDVPGFPRHPHAGFETITICRKGYIDHTDSLGAAARFGRGDVQWMTAGDGIVHSEMFPLVNCDEPNPTELLQIWLNLPREDKKKDPYFTMFWREEMPRRVFEDPEGRETEVTVVAGKLDDLDPLDPPPTSWAAREQADVAVWLITMEPGAQWTVPAASPEANRTLYVFEGDSCKIGGRSVEIGHGAEVRPEAESPLVNDGETPVDLLVLQGRPIDEPVAQHGPFVMNTEGDIRQTMLDYQNDGFGGWPWDQDTPVHDRDRARFAIHIDGTEEVPGEAND
ncbi:MAG: pirin family protein [Bradymonadaceae bacterium]